MKILILFLLSFNCFAGYMSKTHLDNCGIASRPFYIKSKSLCETEQSEICKTVPKNYNCKLDSWQNTQVDDLSKPNYSKSEIETCTDQTDCETKLGLKTCADNQESKLIDAGYTEIYCSKFLNYQQKTVIKLRLDTAKKAVYDAAQLMKTNAENLRKNRVNQMKTLVTKLKAGTDLTSAERRILDLLLIKKLRE